MGLLPDWDWGRLVKGVGEFMAGGVIGYFGTKIEDKIIRTIMVIPGAYLCLVGVDDILHATKSEVENTPEVPSDKLDEYRKAIRLNLLVPKYFDINSHWDDSKMTKFWDVRPPNGVYVKYEAYLTEELQKAQCYSHVFVAKVKPRQDKGFDIISPYIGIGANCDSFVLSVQSHIGEISNNQMYNVIMKCLGSSFWNYDGYYAMVLLLSGKKLSVDDLIMLLRSGYSKEWLDRCKILSAIATGFKIL